MNDDLYPVPQQALFKAGGKDQDFIPGDDLDTIASQLTEKHRELEHLANWQVRFLWKVEGGKSKGRDRLGLCTKASGLLKQYAQCDFVIWLAADHARSYRLTRTQVEAALYHELCHIETGEDKEGNLVPRIAGHDVECFVDEIRQYGAWNQGLEVSRAAWQQLAMFEQGRVSVTIEG